MSSHTTGDYPPLLQPGLHKMTLQQVYSTCVQPFPLSTSRGMIFQGLSKFLGELSQVGIAGDAWVDGSFTTQKLDPADCDLVLCLDGPTVDVASPAIVDLLQKRFDRERAAVKANYHCDAYLRFDYPPGHSHHEAGLQWRAYWLGQFCFDRRTEPKGLAVVSLPVTP